MVLIAQNGFGALVGSLVRLGVASLCIFLLAGLFPPALGATESGSITVSPFGTSSFSVHASNVTDVKSWDIRLEYDTGALSNPLVAVTMLLRRGSLNTDAAIPGNVSVIAANDKPFSFMGNLLSVRFDHRGELPGKITAASVYVTRSSGSVESLPVTIFDPAEPVKKPDEDAQKDTSGNAGSTGEAAEVKTEGAGGGAVAVPRGGGMVQELDGPPPSLPGKQTGITRVTSVLERFRELAPVAGSGELWELFRATRGGIFRQEPPVALADGKTSVTVSVNLENMQDEYPVFLLSGAHFVRFIRAAAGLWSMQIVPKEGVYQASLTVQSTGGVFDFPLVVAPLWGWYLRHRGEGPEGNYLDTYVRLANRFADSLIPDVPDAPGSEGVPPVGETARHR